MRRVIILCVLLFLIINIDYGGAEASTASNQGYTGLWEYPTAEMPDDGVGRFGYTHNSPYAYYFLDIAWLPWFEINARFSLFDTIFSENSRRYMDKAMDLKAILWHNKDPKLWYVPSIAAGIVDMMGTEVMKSWYGVATWRWGDFAATIGYGTDRLNGVFAGLEWDIASWLTVKAEYSPLDYDQEKPLGGGRIVRELPSSKYNYGLILKAPWGMEGSVSRQRGDEWAFSISQRINLAGPFFGDSRRHFSAPGEARILDWDSAESEELIARLKSGLEKYTRIRDVDIKIEETDTGRRLLLAYENYGYSSHAEAMARILVVLSAILPDTDELVLIHKNAGIPVVRASFPGELLFDLRARSLREENSIHSAVFTWASSDIESPDAENLLAKKAQHEVKAMIVYEPRIDQTLAEEYMDRWDIDLIYKGRYSNGWGSIIDIRFPIHVHADTSDYPGLWWEKDFNDKIRIQQAGLTYANTFDRDGRFWLFGEGGYLDEEWFGGNAWARYYGTDGRWWVGARVAALHDRDPYSFGGLTSGRLRYFRGRVLDYEGDDSAWRHSEFIQAGYHIPDLNLDIEADYGRFADNDTGYKIAAIRHWDDTALGFYYIDTDRNAPNKSFTRAGVHMEIPAERWFGTWFGNSSAHVWEQDTLLLSAWDIESGREGGHIRTPERMMGQLRPIALKKNVERMLREYCSYDDTDGTNEDAQTVKSLLEYIIH